MESAKAQVHSEVQPVRRPGRTDSGTSARSSAWAQAETDRERIRSVLRPSVESEREAERVAQHALHTESASAAPQVLPSSTGARLDARVAGPGQPLEPGGRLDMETRLGHGFERVRVHDGAASHASARALAAQAYTFGSDIVFAAGRYAPATNEGRRLLAHELTHVVQQSGAPGFVQRQPAAGAAAAPRKWQDVARDLRFAQISDTKRVPALLQELLEVLDTPGQDIDLLNDVMQLVSTLTERGELGAADRVLEAIRRKFLIAFVTGGALPTGGTLSVGRGVLGDPGTLIDLGQRAARGGDHERAFRLFGAAHEVLSYYALASSESARATLDYPKRYSRYSKFKGIYGELREIYGFYYVLEREALAKQDAKGAAEAREHAAKLRVRLKAENSPFPDALTELGEATQITTPEGRPAFQFHGANFEELDLGELPGHPFPADVRQSGVAQEPQRLDELQGGLMEQVDFQAEIAREPEILKRFGNDPVDLNDTAKRLEVWRIMYGVYKKRGPGSLGALMALMGRYLKAFTYHTGYNVRDFGTSYIDTKFPSDLANRLVRDCGVYALSVAWDVFNTAKTGKFKVAFELATLLDHIILIITDQATGDVYLVNNERITQISSPAPYFPQELPEGPLGERSQVGLDEMGPVQPQPINLDEEITKQYLLVRNLPYLVSPVNFSKLGSSSDATGTFKAQLWTRYLAATQYMSKVPVDFRMLEDFSKDSAALDGLIDELQSSSPGAASVAAFIQRGWPQIRSMLVRFEQIGPKAFQNLTGKPAGSRDGGAFRWPGSNHPLVRIALAMLFMKESGIPLDAEQQKYLTYFERTRADLLDKGRAAARSGRF